MSSLTREYTILSIDCDVRTCYSLSGGLGNFVHNETVSNGCEDLSSVEIARRCCSRIIFLAKLA